MQRRFWLILGVAVLCAAVPSFASRRDQQPGMYFVNYQKDGEASAQQVIDACFKHWEKNKGDCNQFVKAVAGELNVPIASENADGILQYLAKTAPWAELTKGSGETAKSAADAGKFVIGGMKSSEHDPPRDHGHVLVVLPGPADGTHKKYARAAWGSLGSEGKKDSFVNFSFNTKDRDRVRYFSRTLP